jgi:hypothetical protein
MRQGPTASTLIEQNDTIHLWVEITTHGGATSSTRSTVNNYDRHTVTPTTLFDIHSVPVTHIQHLLVKWVDRGIKVRHRASLT